MQHKNPSIFGFKIPCNSLHEGFLKQKMLFLNLLKSGQDPKHYRVHHSANEFARGRRHINGIESFWSYAKTRLARLRGSCSDAFFSHLKETEWRFNHRHDNLYQTLLKNLVSSPLI